MVVHTCSVLLRYHNYIQERNLHVTTVSGLPGLVQLESAEQQRGGEFGAVPQIPFTQARSAWHNPIPRLQLAPTPYIISQKEDCPTTENLGTQTP